MTDTGVWKKHLTGFWNDPGKAQQLLDAFKEGYKKAEETWGDKLPDISSRTYEAVEKKFNDWMNTGTVTE